MRQAVLLGMTAYHPGTDCMQPSYQRSAGEVRGRDLNRIVFFTFNNIQRGHKHCSADSACSCRLLSESRPVQTPHVVGSQTVAGFRDCLNPPARSLVWSTIIPPFNLCYVSRIIKSHGSCVPIGGLDFARIFETLDLASRRFTCDPVGSSNVTTHYHRIEIQVDVELLSQSRPRCEERTVS